MSCAREITFDARETKDGLLMVADGSYCRLLVVVERAFAHILT